jgi:hypothetical protein
MKHRFLAVSLAAGSVLLAGCTFPGGTSTLTGPRSYISIEIPSGWHQVINSSNPVIPEIVAPESCFGANEIACHTALARLATVSAKTAEAATDSVKQSIAGQAGVSDLSQIYRGPARIAGQDGFRNRFGFRNPTAAITAEVAALPAGPSTPDAAGNRPFQVVLAWVTDKPDAPSEDVIGLIIQSTTVVDPNNPGKKN